MAENEEAGIDGDVSDLGGWMAKNSEAGGADDNLKHMIEVLEGEKRDLVRKNEEMNVAVNKLLEEKAEELEHSKREKKALELMKMRASDLEELVARLHHSLMTSREVGAEMRKHEDALLLNLREKTDELERSRSDSRSRIGELEKEIEQSKARLDEMETEIAQLKKEKEEVEDGMEASRTELKRSEEKVAELEERLARLLRRSEVVQGEIEGVAEAAEGDGGLRGLRKRRRFPAAAAVSAGVVVAALVVCYQKVR